MGTDIHSMVEVQEYSFSNNAWGKWRASKVQAFEQPYYREDCPLSEWNSPRRSVPLADRNYTLFALLGDVRNGTGFAGVRTGDPITPIGANRGVPDDASNGWRKYVSRWGANLHSTTYYSLPELTAHPLYGQRLVRTGALESAEYERVLREGGKPREWCGSALGRGVVTVTPDEYAAGQRGEQATYVQYVWEDKLSDSLAELFSAIEVMKKFAPYDHPKLDALPAEQRDALSRSDRMPRDYSRVRLVLGFDN